MALVDYSDSDESDAEVVSAPKPSAKPSKGTFQKVVDRSNPGKIRVSLPQPALQDHEKEDEHPAKRMKTGGGGLSDFKSFLPPPKRTSQTSGGSLGSGNVLRKNGLVAGVSLKTGAAPGFSRDPEFSADVAESNSADLDGEHPAGYDVGQSGHAPAKDQDENNQKLAEEVKLVGRPLMFKPLSVARNPAKKKKKQSELPAASSTVPDMTSVSSTTAIMDQPPQKPKVSLFSIPSNPSDSIRSNKSGEYQPMIYGISVDEEQDPEVHSAEADSTYDEYAYTSQATASAPTARIPGAQSLNDIASDLNLSAAERRQLFGRQKGGVIPQATKIINFNTDEEYRHNEELRASGEQAVHNPVRAIAPGKHSLKQLVNAAANQKEALEESFAKGKSNRAEASSRYGW
jgi:Mitotic checkpoint regulator, MAD2B-interacting